MTTRINSTPAPVRAALVEMGEHVVTWRKLNHLTAATVAARAGIGVTTLRAIEHGTGSASTEALSRVLRVLGVLASVTRALDPFESDLGRARADEVLPQRVRQ